MTEVLTANTLEMREKTALLHLHSYHRPITIPQLFHYLSSAVQIGSEGILMAAKIRRYHDFDTLEQQMTEDEKDRFYQMERELSRKNAPLFRRSAQIALEQGKARTGNKLMHMAQRYEILSSNNPVSSKDLERRYLRAVGIDDDFPKAVVEAADKLDEVLQGVRQGFLDVEGVDRRWEIVRFNVAPPPRDYPQAYQSYRKLKETIAQEYGIRPDDITQYAKTWTFMFGS